MKKNIKKTLCLLMIFTFTAVLMAGCFKKATPKSLLVSMAANMAKIKSYSADVVGEIDMGNSIGVKMDMTMEATKKPMAICMDGKMSLSYGGGNVDMGMKFYQVEEGDKYKIYTFVNNQWESSKSDKKKASFNKNIASAIKDTMDTFSLKEEKIDVNGMECFELTGKIEGKALMKMIGQDAINKAEEGGVINPEAITDEMEIPITIDIYQKTTLPAKVSVDLTALLKQAAGDSIGPVPITFDKAGIDIIFKEFNKVKEIKVPKEAYSKIQ